MMPPLIFAGKVFSGRGSGKKYIELSWVKRQIKEKLGYDPFPGTLNLKLSEDALMDWKRLGEEEHMEICPEKGYCTGFLYKALIDGLECAVVVPKVKGYPEDVLEVVAAVHLRTKLKIGDGDLLTVTVLP